MCTQDYYVVGPVGLPGGDLGDKTIRPKLIWPQQNDMILIVHSFSFHLIIDRLYK